MANLKQPELKLGRGMSQNFKNFVLRFHGYCIQVDFKNLAKNLERLRLLQETITENIGAAIGNAGLYYALQMTYLNNLPRS